MSQSPTKILRIMRGLPIGGLERRTLDLLESLNRSGEFECSIATLIEEGELFTQAGERGVPARFIPVPHRSHWRGIGALRRHIAEGQFDVVHTQSFYPNVPGRVAARLAGAPVIVAQHHNMFSKKCRRWKHKFYERQLSRWTDRIVVVSEAVRDDYIETVGVDPDKVRVIYNGIEAAPFEASYNVEALREELNVATPRVVALVGRLVEAKDPLTFIRAAALVARERSDVTFLIVGDGSPAIRGRVERIIDELNVKDRVLLTGFRRDVPAIMQLCDVGVLSSRYEGLPGVVLEFFASGVPMVVTDVPGPREIVTHEQDALVVPYRDSLAMATAIVRLLRDDALRARLGAAARHRAADFSLDRMVSDYADLYRALRST